MGIVICLLAISSAHAAQTWQLSQSVNSSINFTYSGFDDPLLDHTTLITISVDYRDTLGAVIDNSSGGSCLLDFSSPVVQQINLNYSEGLYHGNLSYNSESLDNAFQLVCLNSGNSSEDHSFSNANGTITFQYDVYQPLVVDIYSSEEVNQNTSARRLSGRSETLFLLLQNITGDGVPVNVTNAVCTISLHSTVASANAQGIEDYYTARILLPDTGNLTLLGSCMSGGQLYTSIERNLSVEALLTLSAYDLGEIDVFAQPILFAENGTDSFIAHAGYESGLYAQLQTTQINAPQSTLLNRSYEPREGRFGFLDLLNIGDLSLVYSGLESLSANIFSSGSNRFGTEQGIAELYNYRRPTLAILDTSSNGRIDILVAGKQSGTKTTTLLINNGSNLSAQTTTLPPLEDASICYGDFDTDTRYDLFVSGLNASGIESGIYLYNGSDYTLNQSLPLKLYKSSCVLGRFIDPDTTSLLHFGTNDSVNPDTPGNWQYVIYNDTHNWSKTTTGLLSDFNGSIYGDAVIADFSGDGLSDILLCGGTTGNEVLLFYVNDLNASGTFIKVNPFDQVYALPECSISAADYDFDGDLDLAFTGVGTSQPVRLFNNTLSTITTNNAPEPPANISGQWNESTGALWLNWSMGSDSETPAGALSYNLEIESLANGLLLSGQPAVSSKPAQGYLGNMQFRQNYTLYSPYSPENLIVRIQSIDSGLRRSALLEATVLLETCEPKQFWNISSVSGCLLPSTVQNNSFIRIQNGSTLTINENTDLGHNSTILVENGTLTITAPVEGDVATILVQQGGDISNIGLMLSGINLTVQRSIVLIDSQLDHFESNESIIFINTSSKTLDTTGSVDVRYYLELNFTDQLGDALSNLSISNSSGFIGNSSRINLTSIWINVSGNTSRIHNLTFSKTGYYNESRSFTLSNNTLSSITLNKDPAPETGIFNVSNLPSTLGGNYTSDLSAFSAVANVSIYRTGMGSIQFLEDINLSFVNLSKALSIQTHSIYINETAAPGLNRSARLQFENLSFNTVPTILRNGVICQTCSNQSYNGSTFEVIVPSFSNYSLENNSQVNQLTPSVLFNATSSPFSVAYHAYSNSSDIILGASCSVVIDSNNTPLVFDGANHTVYLFFNSTGTYTANVSCLGNSSYEPLNQTFTLNVVRSGAYFLKDSEYTGLLYTSAIFGNLSGLNRFWATGTTTLLSSTTDQVSIPSGLSLNTSSSNGHTVLADLNNDGWNDLLLMGTSDSITSLVWFDNLSTRHDLDISLKNGDAEVLDYDFDGDMDIIVCGTNTSFQPQTLVLQNNLADLDYQQGAQFNSTNHSLQHLSGCNLESSRESNFHWLVIAGADTAGDDFTNAYRVNQSGFTLFQSLGSYRSPKTALLVSDLTEDGITDLIIAGELNGSKRTSFYIGNGSGFTYDATLSGQLINFSRLHTSIAVGRLNNETNQSLILSGITDIGLQALAYGFNGSDFTVQNIALDIEPTYYGLLTLGDIDQDSDLDLLITGQSSSNAITHLYTNTLAQYAGIDTQPLSPAALSANYSDDSLKLNWSNGSDSETPNALLTYSVRVGSTTQADLFYSGFHSQTGNQGNQGSAVISLPNACFSIQVRTVDTSQQAGNWSAITYANNHSEFCNGYDNDCDASTDEDFLYPGTNLFIYNGSINGTPFVCEFYEIYAQENLSCPNSPTNSPGMPCQTNTHNGAVYAWNSATKLCDCDLSAATLKNIQMDSSRSGGGTSFAPNQGLSSDNGINESDDSVEAVARPPPDSEIGSKDNTPKNYFTTTLDGFEIRTEVTNRDDWTYVENEIRNTDRTQKNQIRLHIGFAPSLQEQIEKLRSLNRFERSGYTASFEVNALNYLEESVLLYSIPGSHSLDTVMTWQLSLQSESAFSQKQVTELETVDAQVAEASIITNITETVIDNKTVIRLEIDLKDTVSRVNGIEIEQEIPKCLIEEITDSILEAAIDPALLKHVEIKEADPLLVWRFDRLEDAVNLELTLEALRDADCEDAVTLELLAKSFIYQNQPINKLSVALVILLSLGLAALILSPILLASTHRFHRHDNPHVLRLAKVIARRFHKGVSEDTIVSDLLHNDENKADVHAALAHYEDHSPSHTGLMLYEHRIEIALFFAVLVLSVLELSGLLPGYLDWFKKVLSWAIMLLVVHHANLAQLFFNQEAPRFSITLMLGMFLMHLVRLSEFASNGLSESVGFVFDWYVLIVRLDATHHLSWILFSMGLFLLAVCAIYAAFKLPVRERSLGSVFFSTQMPQGKFAMIGRVFGLLTLFSIFFFTVFNRLIEWLAIAVDSALFVMAAVILLALTLSMIAHHHGHRARHLCERIGEILADGYLIWLGITLGLLALLRPFFPPHFATVTVGILIGVLLLTLAFVAARLRRLNEISELEKIPLALDHLYEKFIRLLRYPRTLVLALAGLLVLQLVVESALYIIPNITGETSHLYGGTEGQTLFSLLGNTGLISQQLFFMSAPDAILYAMTYLMSFIGLIALLLTPVWIWAFAFQHRGHGVASGSIMSWMGAKSNWTTRLGKIFIAATLPLSIFYYFNPVLVIEPLIAEGSAGVRFIPHLLDMTFSGGVIAIMACLGGILTMTVLIRLTRFRAFVSYLSLGLSVSLLGMLYFVTFVRSLILETIALFKGAGVQLLIIRIYSYLLGSLQTADIFLVYFVGGICFAFLLFPLRIKTALVRRLQHLTPFKRVFELAEESHLLEYHDEARIRFAGNLIHHLEHYMRRCDAQGIEKRKQIQLMINHGYPRNLIARAQRHTQALRPSKSTQAKTI